ncbi:branched-chain amino acid aminotransferase 2, chloroplastic-like isoform X2 [Magnolia sinica]|uniref:branched-chain amino acid aminotransferase 2, chloroplastic-like isoform X2 n=1 Tax=Magnolia sinica TaxID=86752 RepID=UPI00265A4E06|nr:branched-chain amino acid aminotransferase 2, chloroplastic-like isoform X2 [Magnolia sinica]
MFLRRLCRRDTIKFSEKLLDRYRFPEFGNYHFYTSRAASSSQQIASDIYRSDEDEANVNWEELGFGIVPTDYMYVMKCSKEDRFSEGKLNRFGNIEMSPSAGVLNYGQGLFEGLKAYKREDGCLALFRPEENALRMQKGAERMCMPSPSVEQFVDAVKQTVLANKRWEGLSPINLFVDDEFHRATPGGTGGVKTISNYAPVLKAQALAKSKGFSDVLYLDSINKRNLEEASSCNVFIVKNDVISTPTIEGTILPGITRKSIIEICPHYGYQIQERPVSVEELMDADEVFCTGTAVVIAPVGSIMYHGKRVEYRSGVETVSQKLYSALTSIQMGLVEDKMGWTVEID